MVGPTPFIRHAPSPPQTLDEVFDFDLDAALTPTERAVVHATPSYGVAKVMGVLFVLFLLVLVWVRWLDARHARAAEVAAIVARYDAVRQTAVQGTTGDVIQAFGTWRATGIGTASTASASDARARIEAARTAAARALARRALALLAQLDYLDPLEASSLAASTHDLLTNPTLQLAPAVDTAALRATMNHAVAQETAVVLHLGRADATLSDLEQGALIASLLAVAADRDLRAEYERAGASLAARAAALRNRLTSDEEGASPLRAPPTRSASTAGAPNDIASEGSPGSLGITNASSIAASAAPGPTASDRARYAERATTALVGSMGIRRVSAAGAAGTTLRIEGAAPAGTLLRVFLDVPEIRTRLLALGFKAVEARGSDGTHRTAIGDHATPPEVR